MTARAERNRRNAASSTGPRTAAGKAVASRNAMTHGLTSRADLVPGESAEALEELRSGLRAALAPVGTLEELLADRVLSCAWRLARLGRVEAALLTAPPPGRDEALLRLLDAPDAPDPLAPEARALGERWGRYTPALGVLSRYEVTLDRALLGTLHELQRLQAARAPGGSPSAPAALDVTLLGAPGFDSQEP